MVIAVVVVYVALVAALLSLVCLPAWRHRLARSVQGSARRWRAQGASAAQCFGDGPGVRCAQSWRRVKEELGWVSAGTRRHGRMLMAALALLLLVPATASLLRHRHGYDGFDHTAAASVNPQVAALLAGERLASPAPLPPALFRSREVEQARPLVASANREWGLLDAEFRQRLLLVFQLMRDRHGYDMVLIEGYRSPDRQNGLAALGPKLTQARAGQSWHQYGLAADCAFLRDGRIVIAETDPWAARGYALFGALAGSMGLTWGGGWRSLKDLGHVELRRGEHPTPGDRT